MRKTNLDARLKITAIILALALLLACVCSAGVFVRGETSNSLGTLNPQDIVAVFDDDAVLTDATTATVWGSTDTNNLWYYGANALNMNGINQIINGWDKSKLSADDPIIIAVIDTGIDGGHELFEKTLLRNSDGAILGYNAYAAWVGDTDNLGNITDINSKHGSQVTGVIAMAILEMGLEDYIKIYPIKANTPPSGNSEGNSFNLNAIVTAINWASKSIGADVINLSLGILSTNMTGNTSWTQTAVTKTLQAAVNEATQTSILVAAAGNDNTVSTTAAYYPAYLDGVLSVMGYGSNGEMYSTSNYGAYDLVAPGESIYTANGYNSSRSYYTSVTGTSMAAPFTSLASALLQLRFDAEDANLPASSVRARMLRNINSASITKNGHSMKKLEITTLLTQDFDGEEYNYSDPTGIYISDNGQRNDADNPDDISMKADSISEVTYTANLTPYGDTSPDLDGAVNWTVADRHGNVIARGRGKSFVYAVPQGGTYTITASLDFGTQTFEDSVIVRVRFLNYVASEVRVTYASQAHLDESQATSEDVLYTRSKSVFSLTGLEYLDKEIEIKWYVNGEYVASGLYFEYTPSQTGDIVISAQYGSQNVTAYSMSFVAQVKPFILRPLDLAALCISIVVLIAFVAVLIIVANKRKKETEAE